MAVASPKISASRDRVVELIARPDLEIRRSDFQGEPSQIVKDPLAMRYFQLREQEYRVLQMLNGQTTYADIQIALQAEFPASRVRMETIVQLIFNFHQNGLLLTSAPGQASRLAKREAASRRSKRLAKILNPFTIRFPGVDPTGLLRRLDPLFGWLFTKAGFTAAATLVLSALLLIAVNWHDVKARLPEAQAFFGFDNLIQMGVLLMFTKTIHELGHALCCRRMGGECHEIGVLLMVLTPAMYCNTSDSWIMPNKWHRIAIGAAGMYVEVVLAAIAAFVWWYSEPGLLHYTALNVMFLSSVATIVFNANPLLRYDGYFILADFLEIPNLAPKARLVILEHLKTACLGMRPQHSHLLPRENRGWFIAYSFTSFVYRWFVTLGILWFVTNALEPMGLAIIGQTLVVIAIGGMVVMPMVQLIRFFSTPGRLQQVKLASLATTATLSTAIVLAIVLVPVPHYVTASFVVEPHNAERIYVNASGNLVTTFANAGQVVAPGSVLARLDNPRLELEYLALQGERAKLQSQLEQLELTLKRDVDVSQMIVQTRAEIERVNAELDTAKQMLAQLELRTTRGGTIIPARNVAEALPQEHELVGWSGSPLDPANRGCFLERETQFCYVGDLDKCEIRLFVDQSDASLLRPGQISQVKPNGSPLDRYRMQITSVSKNEIDQLPRELSQTNGGPLAVKVDMHGKEIPMLKVYEAKAIPCEGERSPMVLLGMHGKAKVRVGSATIGQRWWRFLHSVFHFT